MYKAIRKFMMLFTMPKSLIKAKAADGIGDDDLLKKPETGVEALPLIFSRS